MTFLSLDDDLDTMQYYETVNNYYDGYDYYSYKGMDGYEDSMGRRFLWDEGILIDVLNTKAIFVNGECNVISEEDFLLYAADKKFLNIYAVPLAGMREIVNTYGYNSVVFAEGELENYKLLKKVCKKRYKMDKKLSKQ